MAKARDAFRATGLPSVADDSGLEVDALERHAGCAVGALVGPATATTRPTPRCCWRSCGDVPDERRGAAFVSACALVSAAGEVVVRGEWPGSIVREPRGDGGFGYDPVFLPVGVIADGRRAHAAEKDAVSHRGRALALLLPALRELAD